MNIEKASLIFKALSNPQRLKLYLMVAKNCCGPQSGYDKAFTKACGCMGLTKSTISHHFKELRRSGLVKARRQGQSFTYVVDREVLKEMREWIG